MLLFSRKFTFRSHLNMLRSPARLASSSVVDQCRLAIGQTSGEWNSDWAVSFLTYKLRRKCGARDISDQQQQSAADRLIRREFKSDLREDGIITAVFRHSANHSVEFELWDSVSCRLSVQFSRGENEHQWKYKHRFV